MHSGNDHNPFPDTSIQFKFFNSRPIPMIPLHTLSHPNTPRFIKTSFNTVQTPSTFTWVGVTTKNLITHSGPSTPSISSTLLLNTLNAFASSLPIPRRCMRLTSGASCTLALTQPTRTLTPHCTTGSRHLSRRAAMFLRASRAGFQECVWIERRVVMTD
ncbi:hypothetical protein BC829DRAFT_408377 [Chytridium lagenaria]|nr:hypothetical protein BC829DRAFT_408377 [Chytridium lagenaria]